MVYLKCGYLVGRCQEKMMTQGQAPLYRSAQKKNKWAVRGKCFAGCLRDDGVIETSYCNGKEKKGNRLFAGGNLNHS